VAKELEEENIDSSVNQVVIESHGSDGAITQTHLRKLAKKQQRKARVPHGHEDELNIVALLDAFTIILVFLIKSYAADPAQITTSADLTLPVSVSQLNVVDAVPIVITRKAVLVNNNAVVRMTDKGIDPAEKTSNPLFIPRIHEALKAEADHQKLIARYNNKAKFEGLLLVVADKAIAFHTLTEILYTAGQAEFGNFKFAVLRND